MILTRGRGQRERLTRWRSTRRAAGPSRPRSSSMAPRSARAAASAPIASSGPRSRSGRGSRPHSHVAVAGRTAIGEEHQVFPFASIGHIPQDLKFDGEQVELVIGARNRIREHVTMNPGTGGGGGVTRVGDDNLFMMATHVAHDCIIGSNVIMANNATLGGHVRRSRTTSCSAASRRCTSSCGIGRGAMIGGHRRRRRRRHPLRLGHGRAGASRRPEPRRAEAPRRGARATSTGCAPPSPRCSRARARCRSGCAAPARSIRQSAGRGGRRLRHRGDRRAPSPSRRLTRRVPAPGSPSSPGGASCRGSSPRTAPRAAGPTASWSSTASALDWLAGHPVIRGPLREARPALRRPARRRPQRGHLRRRHRAADSSGRSASTSTCCGSRRGCSAAPQRRRLDAAAGRRHLRGRGLPRPRAARDPRPTCQRPPASSASVAPAGAGPARRRPRRRDRRGARRRRRRPGRRWSPAASASGSSRSRAPTRMLDFVAGTAAGLRPPARAASSSRARSPDRTGASTCRRSAPARSRAPRAAGLAGVAVEAGGVMILDFAATVAAADAAGLFLWAREP